MSALSQKEVLEVFNKQHKFKYDYSLVKYVNSLTPVQIICPVHGVFKQTPKIHKKGNGCPECGIERNKKALKSDIDILIQKAKEVHGDKYDYSLVEYVNAKTKVDIICPVHGVFKSIFTRHIESKGCPKCLPSKTRKPTTDEFIIKAKETHGDKYDYSLTNYVNKRTKVRIKCNKCFYEFEQYPYDHITGCGCSRCSNSLKYTKQIFIEKSNQIHNNKYDYSKVDYVNSQTYVTIICPIHGDFNQKPNWHLQGSGCKQCHIESQPGWSKSNYISLCKQKYDSKTYFYLLYCESKEESFYKIGLAVRGVLSRYKSFSLIPYQYRIVLETQIDAELAWGLEKELKRKFLDKRYIPLITFGGSKTECFILENKDIDYIKEQLKGSLNELL